MSTHLHREMSANEYLLHEDCDGDDDNALDIEKDGDGDDDSVLDIEKDGLKLGLRFANDEQAVKSIENWTHKSLCPLAKVRFRKGSINNKGERVKGRRCYACPHGINRKRTGKGERPGQRLKFTNCPVKVNLNEQEDGSWEITTCHLEHEGHPVTSKLFYSHQQARKLEEDDKDFVKGLIRAKTTARNIADVLSERTGKHFKTMDVRNIISRIKENEEKSTTVEEALSDIIDKGGEVRYKKEKGSNNVEVLWIQTQDMRKQLALTKPHLFECDTTFGTQNEGYKLYVPVFHSKLTNMWEVAGLLFLSTETKEKVEEGIKYFKESLPYNNKNKFIFFTDKDFDYIEVTSKFLALFCVISNISLLPLDPPP